jgi:hypothetical protein
VASSTGLVFDRMLGVQVCNVMEGMGWYMSSLQSVEELGVAMQTVTLPFAVTMQGVGSLGDSGSHVRASLEALTSMLRTLRLPSSTPNPVGAWIDSVRSKLT